MPDNETGVDQPVEGSAGNNYVDRCGIIQIGVYLLFVTLVLFVSLYQCWQRWPSCESPEAETSQTLPSENTVATSEPSIADKETSVSTPSPMSQTPPGKAGMPKPPIPAEGEKEASTTQNRSLTVSVDVDKVSPKSGLINGKTDVMITGKGFQEGATVSFGRVEAPPAEFINPTLLLALTPSHLAGEVAVIVRNRDGSKGALPGGYTYICSAPSRDLLFITIILAGALGGSIHALRSFYWYVGNRRLVWSWVPMYIILPFSGAGIAVIFYLVISAGFFSPTSTSNDGSLIIIAIATLVGLFSQQAALKLQDIANAILTKPEQGKDQATQTSAVKVTTVKLNEGHIKGGNEVTITGTGFADEATVKFGGVPASDVKVVNNTTITAKTPPHDSGKVNVVVTNPDGQSATFTRGYTYTEKVDLTVTSVDPGEGSTSGDEEVMITGTGFVEGATVRFGEEPASEVVITSSTEMMAKTPPHPAATVEVTVTNPDGHSSSLPDGYTYTDMETPADGGGQPESKLDKTSGPATGSDEVKITRTGFSSVKEVTFGGVPVPTDDVSYDNATSTITILTPPHEAGEVDVEVTNEEGRRVKLEQKYTYV